MNTIKLDAAKVREYFEDNCADSYLVEYGSAVAEILTPGRSWHHADFSDCPVSQVYEVDDEEICQNVPICDLARNIDTAVRALIGHGIYIGSREIELI